MEIGRERDFGERGVGPAEEHAAGGIGGGIEPAGVADGPGDGECSGDGEPAEPVVEHDGLGEAAIAPDHGGELAVKAAGGEGGSVPEVRGQEKCDEADTAVER